MKRVIQAVSVGVLSKIRRFIGSFKDNVLTTSLMEDFTRSRKDLKKRHTTRSAGIGSKLSRVKAIKIMIQCARPAWLSCLLAACGIKSSEEELLLPKYNKKGSLLYHRDQEEQIFLLPILLNICSTRSPSVSIDTIKTIHRARRAYARGALGIGLSCWRTIGGRRAKSPQTLPRGHHSAARADIDYSFAGLHDHPIHRR